jgi:hypothetical protein
MRPLVVGVALAALLGSAPAALAQPTRVADANDVRGPLDIRRVVRFAGKKPLFKIVTWSRWTAGRIHDRGYLALHLDVFGNERFDHYALVGGGRRKLWALLFRDRAKKRDLRIGRLARWRRNGRSVTLRVPLAKMLLSGHRRRYRWYLQTIVTGPRCPRVCLDRAPDEDDVEEPLERANGASAP